MNKTDYSSETFHSFHSMQQSVQFPQVNFSVECTYLDRSRSYGNQKGDSWIKVTLVIPVNKLGQIILQTYVQAVPKQSFYEGKEETL